MPINTTIKPFDNLNVRKAVLAVFDRNAVRLARGGEVTGPLATHLLPPGIPGYEEAGGAHGPDYDYLDADKPNGDPALAAKYMKKAGYPSGKYTGDERFLAVAGNTSGEKAVAEVVQAQLAKLGFDLRLRIVPDDALFTSWCSVPSRKVVFCASGIAWLKDFPDPQPMLQPVFDGRAITPTANNNFSQLNDPKINAAMTRAQLLTGKERAAAWGAIDRMIAAHAPVIPLQWDVATLIRLQGRRRRAELVLRQLGPVLHVAEVALPERRRPARGGPSRGMRMRGLEPPRDCSHGDLNAARLPIPPHPPARREHIAHRPASRPDVASGALAKLNVPGRHRLGD